MRPLPHLLAPALLLLVSVSFTTPTLAAEAGADPDVQSTITSQIDAFNQGDAIRAESFASPGVKSMFPDAASFFGMVQQSYSPLVHPRSTHFEPTVTSEASTIQHVTLVDAKGVVWTAIYSMEKVDGHWAISGCVLVKSPETSA